jgi:hypothetical protein
MPESPTAKRFQSRLSAGCETAHLAVLHGAARHHASGLVSAEYRSARSPAKPPARKAAKNHAGKSNR